MNEGGSGVERTWACPQHPDLVTTQMNMMIFANDRLLSDVAFRKLEPFKTSKGHLLFP